MKRAALGALLASALLVPASARAETLPGSQGAQDALLAVAPDGSPRVAFVGADGSLEVAARATDGTWTAQPLPGLPGRALVAGLAVAPAGGVDVLAEDPAGHWLALAEQQGTSWRVRTVATVPAGGLLGFGGLVLDRTGLPVIAYVYELASHKTWLRLVHESPAGTLAGERVTRDGFPSSDALPSAAPVVLPGGAVRVLETYTSATIEWARTKDHKDWKGQIVYGTVLGSPAGVVQGAAVTGAVWSAWTELFPSFGESQLLLGLHGHGETTTILSHHAFLVSLVLAAGAPEVGADDYVDLAGARTAFAGIVANASGTAVELAGDLFGYAVDPSGGRQYLLLDQDGLGWYRAATAPTARVDLSVTVDGASFLLSGRVEGAAAGASVEVWRETETGPQLFTSLPLAPDGTFSTADLPPARPLTYRVVYRDPVTALPLASLFRTLLGT